ncbi:MAG: hypothetical protein ACI3YQ_10700 [Prevotella sp.]
MKKTIFTLAAMAMLAFSCQESLEDRCEREAKEFNEKKCPAKVTDGVTIDSLVFERSTHTLHYYYTFSGLSDNKAVIEKLNPRKLLIDEIRNSTTIRAYKEAGYNFHYTYWSASAKKPLADVMVTEKEYSQKKE